MSITLFNEDCIEAMSALEDNSVDMVMTSPPYDNLRTYGQKSFLFTSEHWEPIIKGCHRVLKDGGVMVWVVGDATINGSETGSSFKQALYAMEIGFNLHDTMIWNKNGFSAVGSLSVRYGPVFEYMFVFSKGKPKTFNPLKDRKNKHTGPISGTIRQKDGSLKPMTKNKYQGEYGIRFNVWEISPNRAPVGHPAPFPVQIAEDHIKSWSDVGDVVLDPFMGSGTTGVSCSNLKRNFIGVEINKDYFEIAKKRIAETIPESTSEE